VADPFRLTVLAPTGTLLEAEGVTWVRARLSGSAPLSVYPGHAPLIGETEAAPLEYADRAGEHALELEGGILQVEEGGVTLFVGGPMRQISGETQISTTAQILEDDIEFDRLARQLLVALQAEPEGVMGEDDGI